MSAIEESFIGSCFVVPEYVKDFELKPEHFSEKQLGKIWSQIKQGNTDPVSIAHELGNEYEQILQTCVSCSQPSSIQKHAEKITQEHSKRLFLFELGTAYQRVENGSDIDSVLQNLLNHQVLSSNSGYVSAGDVALDAYKLLEEHDTNKFIPTGFDDIDFVTGGAERGTLIIVAGRPSMGKTAYAMGACMNAAKTHHVCFSSIEMDKQSVGYRMLSSISEMDLKLLRTGAVKSRIAWRKAANALNELQNLNFYIDDNPNRTAAQIISQCRKQKIKTGVDILMVDYLGLLESDNRSKRKNEQIGDMTRAFKKASKELDIAIILLCQLNREAEGIRPNMSMLRDSGSVEQDADVILFPYRYKNDNGEEDAEMIIAKNRNGPTTTVSMRWNGDTASYRPAVKMNFDK